MRARRLAAARRVGAEIVELLAELLLPEPTRPGRDADCNSSSTRASGASSGTLSDDDFALADAALGASGGEGTSNSGGGPGGGGSAGAAEDSGLLVSAGHAFVHGVVGACLAPSAG